MRATLPGARPIAAALALAVLAAAGPAAAAAPLERRQAQRVLIEAQDDLASARTKLADRDSEGARSRLGDAEEGFRQILEGDPTHRAAAAGLGAVLYLTKRHEEAITLLEPLARQEGSGDDVDIAHQLGLNLYQQGRHDDAVPWLEKATIEPERFDAMWILAVYHYRRAGWTDGLPHLQNYVEARPGDERALGLLGTYLLKLERYKEAVAAFDRFLTVFPDNVAANINRANALFRSGDLDRAADAYESLRRAHPERARLGYNLAAIRIRQDRCPEAVDLLDDFVSKRRSTSGSDEGNGTALYFKGNCELELDRNADAAVSFREVIQVSPNNPWAHHGLSRISARAGNLAEALVTAERAAELLDSDWELATWLGTLLRRNDRVDEALVWHDKAADLAPEVAAVQVERGRDLWALSLPTEARYAFTRALELDPENKTARDALAAARVGMGIAARTAGDLEGARGHFASALADAPSYEAAIVNLALLELSVDDPDAARRALSGAATPGSPDVETCRAALALAEGRTSDAGLAADRALAESSPLRGIALQVRGYVHADTGRWADAGAAFDAAWEIGKSEELRAARALAWLQAGLQSLGRADARAALASLRRADAERTALDGEDAFLLDFALAAGAVAATPKSGKAVARLDKLISGAAYRKSAWRPLADVGHLYVARAHLDAGSIDASLAALGKVRDRSKHEVTVRAIERAAKDQRARASYAKGAFGKAAATWKKLAATQADPVVSHNLAAAKFSDGAVDAAAAIWSEQAETARPPEALFNLALVRDRQGGYDQALKLLERYLERRGVAADRARDRVQSKRRALGLGGGQ